MFEVGQKVRAKENSLDIPIGEVGTVTEVNTRVYPVRVKFPSGRKHPGSLFLADEIEAINKQEESVQQIKVGDTVEVIDLAGGHHKQLGEKFKVKAVEPGLATSDIIVLEDPTRLRTAAYAYRFEVVQPKPAKTKSQEILLHEVQAGDELVCFINYQGVELRKKGVAHAKSPSGQWHTEGGANLTYFAVPVSAPARHIYLLNRPEPKKPEIESGVYWVTEEGHASSPWTVTVKDEEAVWVAADGKPCTVGYKDLVIIKSGKYADGKVCAVTKFHTEDPTPKGFAALDKTKTYLLKDKRAGGYRRDWYLAFKDGKWKYGSKGVISTTAGGFEDDFTEGTNAWDKPVEYIVPPLTDLERFERAGYVGKKFDGGTIYKVTRKGKVKYKAAEGWVSSFHSADTFFEDIKDGLIVGI